MMPARLHVVRPCLRDLLAGAVVVDERDDREIRGLTLDSRAVRPGDLFLACAGCRTHGLAYLRDALAAGAAAVAYEVRDAREARVLRERYAVAGTGRTPLIAVPGLSRQAGPIAGRFYGQPSRDLTVIGITGTNGKTSCSHYLAQSLDALGRRCGVIGTLGAGLCEDLSPAGHTTPDAVNVQRLLAELRARGAQAVSLEVSSHGLHQGRVNGVHFDTALFTNLTRDHLDYHGDMRAYGKAKAALFESVGLRRAVVNAGDPFGRRILDSLSPEVRAVGFRLEDGLREAAPTTGVPMVLGADVQVGRNGCALRVDTPWGSGRIETGLQGRFNAENLLAVLAVLLSLEVPLTSALDRLSVLRAVPGRMEVFGGGPDKPLVVVDYAHTPDALEQILGALRAQCAGELWCVFGCGGERDPGKRPLMGAVAERLADRIVLTDDNPRGESATDIVMHIQKGMRDPDRAYVRRERGEAIALAVRFARPADVVLVAGKGHEQVQVSGGRATPFSDREEVARDLAERRS